MGQAGQPQDATDGTDRRPRTDMVNDQIAADAIGAVRIAEMKAEKEQQDDGSDNGEPT